MGHFSTISVELLPDQDALYFRKHFLRSNSQGQYGDFGGAVLIFLMVEASFRKIKTKALFKVGRSIFITTFYFSILPFYPRSLFYFSIKIFHTGTS